MLEGQYPLDRTLIDLRENADLVDLTALASLGVAAVLLMIDPGNAPLPSLYAVRNPAVIAPGDVIRVRDNGQINVLFRRAANANAVFTTERCNSRCLMCSQPPREIDDTWRVREILDLLPLIDRDLQFLGFTGGEPTLLGSGLCEILSAASTDLPSTRFHVLTNGRTFQDSDYAAQFGNVSGRVTWGVPLYADVAALHDYVVQAPGAFAETIDGIYNLGELGHRIEIRCVVHAQTLPRLQKLGEFIYRNMPFVSHVALMGLEPMGFAKGNRDLLWVDPADYKEIVQDTAERLQQSGMNVSLYNMPLCTLDRWAWPLARQSISDWKNNYAPECEACEVRGSCAGFFQSTDATWRSRNLSPIRPTEVAV
ncbi:His-Xaa-Ser system radical SAM maturase HxsC [Faunimonas pinastri]|nr:His-Xaa-Ser system radical SAM maturase HxsC [Faunimonas pinastri]